MLIGKYNKSVLVTYLGVVLSLTGISFGIKGNFKMGFMFLMFAGICDLFDGKFARLFSRNKEEQAFGVQIDSLADMINFIAAPIVLIYCFGLDKPYHLIIYAVYTLAGITRLAYFNIQAEAAQGVMPFYRGLPVTYSALIFPIVWISSFWIPKIFAQNLLIISMGITAVCFVLNIKIRKPRGIAYVFFLLLAVFLTLLILFMG